MTRRGKQPATANPADVRSGTSARTPVHQRIPSGAPGTNQPNTTAHPHGFLGYVVDDDRRTKNCLRLLRGAVIGAAVTGVVVTLVLWLLLQLATAAAVVGGLSATAAASAAWFARQQRRGKRR
jgi:hypothetical protein